MVFTSANQQVSKYTIATPVYEGTLDLLLQLIEHSELDITKLSLALVTDQYLEYIHQITDLQPDEVSAFLVIAAKLAITTSEALLPRQPVREPGATDAAEDMATQFILQQN